MHIFYLDVTISLPTSHVHGVYRGKYLLNEMKPQSLVWPLDWVELALGLRFQNRWLLFV